MPLTYLLLTFYLLTYFPPQYELLKYAIKENCNRSLPIITKCLDITFHTSTSSRQSSDLKPRFHILQIFEIEQKGTNYTTTIIHLEISLLGLILFPLPLPLPLHSSQSINCKVLHARRGRVKNGRYTVRSVFKFSLGSSFEGLHLLHFYMRLCLPTLFYKALFY